VIYGPSFCLCTLERRSQSDRGRRICSCFSAVGAAINKLLCLVPLFISALTPTLAQRTGTVEDTIAGFTVGKSTLGDIQRRFGRRLNLDRGRKAVQWDGECEIFFDFDADNPKPSDRVENIQLLNLGRGSEKGSRCNKLATGRGLMLSNTPERVRALYGSGKQFEEKNNERLGYNTVPPCSAGSKATVVLHNFGVEWTPGSMGLQDIDLGITRTTCDELNSE